MLHATAGWDEGGRGVGGLPLDRAGCRVPMSGGWAERETQADALLARDPASIAGLILKGDCRLGLGDDRGAASFFLAARRAAARMGALPPGLAADMRRIEALLDRLGGSFRLHLEATLAEAGVGPAEAGPRFAEALAILFQEREARLELQRPSLFFFPGLPQREFYERAEFPWLAALEAQAAAIRAELIALLAEGDGFRPYVVPDPGRPYREFYNLHNNPQWSAFHLIEDGRVNAANAARFPRTMAALEGLPLCDMPGRTPSVHFSLLKPGARIPPHGGMLNTRLICHLPLIVPAGCALRVGRQTRAWEEGKALIFDDSIEHEAWNGSAETRVILLFDIWRPELAEAERRAVATMFRAIDSYCAG